MSAPAKVSAGGQRLGLRLFLKEENLTLDDAAKFIRATQTLLREVEKSVTGKKRARIKWQVVKLGYECDGCGAASPAGTRRLDPHGGRQGLLFALYAQR